MSDFEVVEDFVRPPPGQPIAPRLQAVLDGYTIFVRLPQRSIHSIFRAATKRGYRLRSHKAERNGVLGVYVWAEKNGTAPE